MKTLLIALMLLVPVVGFAGDTRELFVSYQCWKSDSTYNFGWDGYMHPAPVTGKALSELTAQIKKDRGCKHLVILNWQRFEKRSK